MTEVRKPLPAGAIMRFGEDEAEVVMDPGGDGLIDVLVDGEPMQWEWTVEGVDCTLVTDIGVEREPFVAGTIIAFLDMLAVVVADDGGDKIKVMVEEHSPLQNWWYRFDGHPCTVSFKPELSDAQRAEFEALAGAALLVGKGHNEPGNRLYNEAYKLWEQVPREIA